jgi:hypothetical protein
VIRNILRPVALSLPVVGLAALLVVRPFGLQNQLPRLAMFGLGEDSAQTADGCDPGRPSFQYGYAALKLQLGSVMGDPLDCEHAIHINGDTRQTTTTGYAYYRTAANIPAFARGTDHWALTTDGLVRWSGDVVDPPTP